MQTITIKAKAFFEIIKSRDLSMWDLFAEMIDGQEKEITFLDETDKIMMRYILPKDKAQLNADKREFASLLNEQLEKIKTN